jgi:hypothetical protein
VLDGSVSMQRLSASGELERLVGLVSGVMVEWTKRWATTSVVAGVRVSEVSAAATQPNALTYAAFDGTAPSSWASVGAAAKSVARRVGRTGAVVVICDGVPGDLSQLDAVVGEYPGVRYAVVTVGVSASYALSSDEQLAWWEDELAGFSEFASLPNTAVIAIQQRDSGQLELAGSRAAEVALRLTQELGASA